VSLEVAGPTALRSMVKGGQEPRGFPLSPPRGSLVARCLGAVEDRLSERSASCRPKLTMSRVAGRSEANCRISISVAFLPQKIAPASSTSRRWQTFRYHLSTAELPKKKSPPGVAAPSRRRSRSLSPIRCGVDRALDAPRKAIPECMAPNDNWSHVCARSVLDRLLGVFVDCVCELCICKTIRPCF
jgi:hypothetical protein